MSENDPRLKQILYAAREIAAGQFDVPCLVDGTDEVAELGRVLERLGGELRQRFSEMGALVRMTKEINSGLLLEDVLNRFYDAFRGLIPFERIGFSIIETQPDGTRIAKALWSRAEWPVQRIKAGYCAPLADSSLQQVMETGEPRIINDLDDYLKRKPHSKSTRLIVAEGVRSSLTCPLIAEGKPVGFVFFSSRDAHAFDRTHVEFLQEIVGQLSITLQKTRMYEELLLLNQLKNRFFGMAAHDLRNPLGFISGTCNLLGAGVLGELSDDQQELVKQMQLAGDEMLRMIDDLLEASAMEAGRLEIRKTPTGIAELLVQLKHRMALQAERKGIVLEVVAGPSLGEVEMDGARIQQVLANLVGNAVKFAPSGSRVEVSVANTHGGMVEFSIEDQGPGIPEGEQQSLFNAFARGSVLATAGEKSTGLGLAICKRIVDEHHGELGVESRVGAGSRFWFRLPCASEVVELE